MQYISTRGGMPAKSFSDVVIGGLASDGGLIVPEAYPLIGDSELNQWRSFDYPQLAFAVISRFATDIPTADLHKIIEHSYTAEIFGSADITPITRLDEDLFLLGLSNGPTLAFKDLAMQFLGNLMDYVLAKRGQDLNILGATSGDTGSAAEHAMKGKQHIQVFMLSPHGKVSPFQAAQMFSLQEDNIHNIAINGVFDDCQDIVKNINEDAEFKHHYRIGAVNSINWARVVAQIVYYFKAYFAVTKHNQQQISMAVPSGNFGNIYAGYVARCMGLPIHRLILATNENNVLDEFFRTGIYRVRPPAEVHHTTSPSMDISKASNFERFVFDLLQRDTVKIRQLWQQLSSQGYFDLSASEYFQEIARYGFCSGSSNHDDRVKTIQRIRQDYGIIIDTHTADGLRIGLQFQEPGIPLICQETAQAVKFEDAIVAALGQKPERPAQFLGLEEQPQRVTVLPADSDAIKAFIQRFVTT